MSIIGVPTEWIDLIESKVPQILALVIETWEGLPPPDQDGGEDKITNALCRALMQNRTVRGLPFQIRTQVVELEPMWGEDLGRMDIAFIPPVPREDIYFCLECKRLNVVKDGITRAYASEYVMNGMLRFVTGQYAKAVRHGGMMGYVLDGNVSGALTNIEANIKKHHVALGMTAPGKFRASTILKREKRARETHHHRKHPNSLFRIHHLLMGRQKSTEGKCS